MNIQPGTGYTFSSSNYGTNLNIETAWTESLVSSIFEQFSVVISENKVFVAQGVVVAQDLTNEPLTILHEYLVNAFSVYPTGSLTTGSDTSGVWCSQTGNVEIANQDNSGSNFWGVYLIRIYDSYGGGYGMVNRPSLAVMADGSEAENYSNPWEGGIEREYVTIRPVQTVTIEQPSGNVTAALVLQHHCAIKRYQCQRIKIASIEWSDATGWTVTQHLIGSLYMPNNVHPDCEIDYEAFDQDGPVDPPDIDWPLNSAEKDLWFGDWAGYTKVFAGTTDLPV